MSMLTARAMMQHHEAHHLVTLDSNHVACLPPHFASSAAASSSMIPDWPTSIAPPSCNPNVSFSLDVPPPASLPGAGIAGDMRVGYATRSATGALQRSMSGAEAPLVNSAMFGHSTLGGNGGAVRKKRRRYGPKPEPPYKCFCGKTFKRHEHMLRHRATHDESIKYECHICGKWFRRQDVMHRHTMTHTTRNRLHSKMRTTASAESSSSSSSSLTTLSAVEASKSAKEAGDSRAESREQDHLGCARMGAEHDVLEDPTLRVGLTDYPVSPTSVSYNEDHHIAAAQLYNACNPTRYIYPSYSSEVQPGHAFALGPTVYDRAGNQLVMAPDHHRGASSVSPPPSFFASSAAYPTVAFDSSNYPRLGLTSVHYGGYDVKAGPYAISNGMGLPTGYGLGPASSHVGVSESEWSEPSPSGPSTHSFASPAWSQRAELMKRDGPDSAMGTPSSLSRPLMVAAGARWREHPPHPPQGSPLLADGQHVYRSPAPEARRRPSTALGHSHADEGGESRVKTSLSDRPTGSLGIFAAPSFGEGVSESERFGAVQFSSPQPPNGALAVAPLGMGMSDVARGQAGAQEGEHGGASMLCVPEPLDSGSPLTEATGQASPRSMSYGKRPRRAESEE